MNKLSSYATCELAKESIQEIAPLNSVEEAQESFKEIFAAQLVISMGQRPFLESLDLFRPWYARLEKEAILTTLELKDVRHFSIEAVALKEVLIAAESEWGTATGQCLFEAEEVLSAIDQIVTPDGGIRLDASEKLYSLNQEKNQQVKHVQKILCLNVLLHTPSSGKHIQVQKYKRSSTHMEQTFFK